MSRASVLIPTHEHPSTLPFAVASVQAQGVEDIEILIVGDGVSDETRAIVADLRDKDSRILFFDFPKGPRHGEIHRDAVLRQAQGDIVYYQCDDDLWLPDHLLAMERALEQADFVGAMHVDVDVDDQVVGYYFDLERSGFTTPWLGWVPNRFGAWSSDGFGLQCAAHRLDAYLRLPEGWATTAEGFPPSQTMWHKFFRQSWCRIRFLQRPVSLHFSGPDRINWTAARHAAELQRWLQLISEPAGLISMYQALLKNLGDRLLREALWRARK
jgi:glycosyltransferase involved in cell wall biosynthesis